MTSTSAEETISECPICFDSISSTSNNTITECGHRFHTNCLMKNVLHNGFGCPYCRTAMCEEPEEVDGSEEDEDYTDQDENDSDEEETREWIEEERRRRTEDRSFYLMRNLFRDAEDEIEDDNRNEIQEIGGDDFSSITLESEDDDDTETYSESESEQEDFQRERPTTDYITEALLSRGVTMQHLVKLVLSGHFPMYHDIMSRRNLRRDTQNLHANIIDIIEGYTQAEYQEQLDEEENHQPVTIELGLD